LQTLVMAYLDSDKPRKAQEIAVKMLENHPQSDESFFSLGLVHLRTNNPIEAEKCFREALRINPTNSLARNNLGIAVLRQESRQATTFKREETISIFDSQPENGAMEHFTEAIKLEPNNELILQNLKNQFNYSIYFFLIISLTPFGFLSFLVIPSVTAIMILFSILSLSKLLLETFKRKRSASPEMQMFLKTLKRKTLNEYFQEFTRIASKVIFKNWQPHVLAMIAVIVNFVGLSQNTNYSPKNLLQSLAVFLIVSSGIWLSIKLSRG
ncbi:MAG TPA: tetratricopeptide repeat protein, partial [Pyrinomonadaceae bacterium]|nr:tetratricopeptide repeat protein [Pyrinomonadaceae bacterium]